MSQVRKEIIERMKSDLLKQVDEWVGMHRPVEGSEDYETWQWKLDTIRGIETIDDVIEYVECNFQDLNDFLLTGEYELITAGLAPEKVPSSIVSELGELIAEQVLPNDVKCEIFIFDGKYFVLDGTRTQIVDSKKDALTIAGIEEDSSDDFIDDQEYSTHSPNPQTSSSPKKAKRNRRAVLIVIPSWPSGTIAMKFGSALRNALNVEKDEMTLLQMAPERIFRVETDVSEAEFRERMKSRGFNSNRNVLFIEMGAACKS
jgi:hypothetical protein